MARKGLKDPQCDTRHAMQGTTALIWDFRVICCLKSEEHISFPFPIILRYCPSVFVLILIFSHLKSSFSSMAACREYSAPVPLMVGGLTMFGNHALTLVL